MQKKPQTKKVNLLTKLKKQANLFALTMLIFSIAFNYFVFKNLKDSLWVSKYKHGAEVIVFIKIFLIIPSSIFFTKFYPKLLSILSPSRSLILMMLPMTLYSIVFLYTFEANDIKLSILRAYLPSSWNGFITMIERMDFSIFYVLSELWGSVVLQAAFWGFVNDITTIQEAKKGYNTLIVTSAVSGIAAGAFNILIHPWLQTQQNPWELMIKFNLLISLLLSLLSTAVILIIEKINPKEKFIPIPKSDFVDISTIRKCMKNSTVFYLSLHMVCFGIIASLSEILWKSTIKEAIVDPSLCAAYLNKVSFISNIIGVLAGLAINILFKHLGWFGSSLIIVFSVAVPSIFMFSSYILTNFGIFTSGMLETTLLIGSIQSTMTRAMRTSLGDFVKDIALVPHKRALKASGKAIIDSLMSRVGKFLPSIFFAAVLTINNSLKESVTICLVAIIISSITWLYSLKQISKEFKE